MKVLHGKGKPRLRYKTTGADLSTTVDYVEWDHILTRDAITEDIVNRGLYAVHTRTDDGTTQETWTKVISVDGEKVYTDGWSNGTPDIGSALSYKYTIYDLPYCQNNMIENFEPDIIEHLLYNGTKAYIIRGWWYSVVLDYSRRITPDTTKYFEPLFDKTRTYDVDLFPRKDNVGLFYQVELHPTTALTIAQKPFHAANKLFKVSLVGVNRLSSIDLDWATAGILTNEDGDPITTENGDYIYV